MLRVHRLAAAIDMIAAGTRAPMPIAANAMPANHDENWLSNSSGTIVLPSGLPVAAFVSGLTPAVIATYPSSASRPSTSEYAGSATMFRLMTLRPREASTLVSECGYRNSASAEPSASVAYCSWLLAVSRIDPAGLPVAGSILLTANNQLQYATLALGSALALFLYPHSLTSVLASRGRNVIKRNMVALPAYSLVLGLLALLGYVAITAGVKPLTNAATGKPDGNTIVPLLFDNQFSSWFAGIAFAAIGIGALVPAAIMSIAAANLWTRNIYKEYIRKNATPKEEAKQAKLASLVVKLGAVAVIILIDPQFSIDLQLIGGVLILQTLPAVALALYTRWFHRWGLIAGWIVGIGWGLIMLYGIPNPANGKQHFGGSALALGNMSIFGWHPFSGSAVQIYVGFVALIANLVVA